MTIQELITGVIPYYNNYKKNQRHLSGADALEIIWEVGDLLKNYLKDKDIAPRTLYHQIYGKSEGDKDIVQKSYITRDFLDRAYRVRRIFDDKSEIKKTFPDLKRYRLFYKSMPFLDDGRFQMSNEDKAKLIKLLNSNKGYNKIITEVAKLRENRIGLKIPRDSKLKALNHEKEVFINFYNSLYGLIKQKEYKAVKFFFGAVDEKFIDILSRNTGALSSDKLQLTELEATTGLTDDARKFTDVVIKLSTRKDATERRRFRRLIPPAKMIRLSEMIYAMRSEDDFNKFRL